MSLSRPSTLKPRAAKERTASEPISPADPVTRTVPTEPRAYPSPDRPARGGRGLGAGWGARPPAGRFRLSSRDDSSMRGPGSGMPDLRTRISSLAFAAALGLPAAAGAAPINPAGPTTGWLAIGYPGPVPDVGGDQNGNGNHVEGDIVGNASNPAFYTAFDDAGTAALTDGMLGF